MSINADAMFGDAKNRRTLGGEAIAAAEAGPDAADVIADGDWAGFTCANATAWTWNLYQYEAVGFGPPVSPLSFPDVREWLGGGLPMARNHPARARAYEAAGISAELFRRVMEISDASRRPARYLVRP